MAEANATFGGGTNRVPTASSLHGWAARSLDTRLWEGVNRLLDRAASLDDLRAHGLQLLALARWRETGRPIPGDLVAEARAAAMASLAAPLLLQRVRESCHGPIVLLKGPETAACYPQPSSRPFGDLDILVPDPSAVQRALIAAGFNPIGEERLYRGSHQLQPLHYPGSPLLIEVHVRPHWVEGIPPPPVDTFFESAVVSVVPVEGISALPRAPHAVLLAAHAWAHEPLGSLRHLIDVAAARQGTSASEVDALATAWGIGRIWRTMEASVDALLFSARRPWPLRIWARNLGGVRERTVLETHLGRWFAAFSAYPLSRAACMLVRAAGADVRPVAGEDWPRKLRRTCRAMKNAFVRRSHHNMEVERAFVRGRFTCVEEL